MKTVIAIICLCVALFTGHAQTNQTAATATTPNSSAPKSDELTTRNGLTFKGAHIEKVEPIGLVISYQTPGGGLGITTVRFEDLPDSIRDKYGFDPKKAAAFDAARKKATAEMTQRLIADDQNAKQIIAQREAAAEVELQAQKKAEEQWKIAQAKAAAIAAMIQATNHPYQPPRPGMGYLY